MSNLTEPQQRWVDALRSGKYGQCRGRLRQGDGYCCLGVACDVFKGDLGVDWENVREENIVSPEPPYFFFMGRSADLPPGLVEILGLVSPMGEAKPVSGVDAPELALSSLNDNGCSFDEIADRIESGDYFKPTTTQV